MGRGNDETNTSGESEPIGASRDYEQYDNLGYLLKSLEGLGGQVKGRWIPAVAGMTFGARTDSSVAVLLQNDRLGVE